MVLRHGRCLGGIRVQALREPDVLADDLARRLDVGAGVVLLITDAPALQTQVRGQKQETGPVCWDESRCLPRRHRTQTLVGESGQCA